MSKKRSKYYQTLHEDVKLRYDAKIELCGGIDPYTLTKKDLSTNREDFPEITLLDIGNYMVHSVSSFSKRGFKAYKSMEAYSFFESGFVLNIEAKKTENSSILKARVRRSQKMNETPHKVWILAKIDGEIICAHCTCTAGLSESCSHVGAVCFAVMSIMESDETTSVTDLLCKWNVPKYNAVSMSSMQEIKWTSASYEDRITPSQGPESSSFSSYVDSLTKFSDDDVVNFLNTIHSDGQESTIRDLIYPCEVKRKSKINDDLFLANWYSSNNTEKSHRELVEMAKSRPLIISHQDLEEISRLTVSNRKSKFWVALRRGRITGSILKDCIITSIDNPSLTTINRLITPLKNLDRIPSIKYQRKNLKKAIDCYVKEALFKHESFVYRESGLIINQDTPYFACSTDGYVSCDCHGNGCLEVKCMKILETTESFDVLTCKPNNILNKVTEKYSMEKHHEVFYKIQMQIHLSAVNYCDFVIWSPKQTLTLTIYADTEFWLTVSEKALKFHQEVVMPELLGKFYTGRNGLEENNENDIDLIDFPESMQEYNENNVKLIGLEIQLLDSEGE